MDIINIYDTVKKLLMAYPELRDNDHRLVINVWAEQDSRLLKKGCSFMYFAALYRDGKLSSSESITRSRRKLQEEFEHLRGVGYTERQNEQNNVKKQIKELTNRSIKD